MLGNKPRPLPLSLQNQDVVPISSYDTAGSFLILGCNNGSIYYIGKTGVSKSIAMATWSKSITMTTGS